jgi:hypothetical protein
LINISIMQELIMKEITTRIFIKTKPILIEFLSWTILGFFIVPIIMYKKNGRWLFFNGAITTLELLTIIYFIL